MAGPNDNLNNDIISSIKKTGWKSYSSKKKVGIIVSICLLLGGVLLVIVFGVINNWWRDDKESDANPDSPVKSPTRSPTSGPTSGPDITNGGLFLIGVVTDNGPNSKGYIIPVPISKNNDDNSMLNPSGWSSFGKRMGITPLFEDGEFKIILDNSLNPSLIQSVTFIATPKSGVVPGVSSDIVITDAPVSAPLNSPQRMVLYNYILRGAWNDNQNKTYSLYKINNGVSNDLALNSSDLVEEVPDYEDGLNGYNDLMGMAYDNLEANGYCTTNCNSIPNGFPNS